MPSVKCSAANGARLVASLRERVVEAAMTAEATSIEDAKRELEKASQGTISTKELRKMGHPFATRDPQTPLDSAVINDQGGAFSNDWIAEGPFDFGAGGGDEVEIVSRAYNIDPIAVFMFGTRKMIARPIVQRVMAIVKDARTTRLTKAVTDVLNAPMP